MLNRKKNDRIEDIDIEMEEWRSQNKEKVEIILFPGEYEYLTKKGHLAKAILYEISSDILYMDNCPNFIKAKYNKKQKKLFKLKKREKRLLDDKGIKYKALGYIVYL